MHQEIQRELYRIQREVQNKYVYFLLAAAGACTAFALNQTRGEQLTLSHLFLIGALMLWALSFYCGCKHLQRGITHIFLNQRLNDNEIRQNAPDIEGRNFLEKVSNEVTKYFHRQFTCFVLGTLSYSVWHLLEMALRNPVYATWLSFHFPLL